MEKRICILIFSVLFTSCYNNSWTESYPKANHKTDAITLNESLGDTRHFITDHDCHIIKEWLDRKSFVHFIKKHIAAIRTIDNVIEKIHLNDTFIP